MACDQQSALAYVKKTRANLVSQMQNFPVIVENLYQRRVFNDYDVKAVKAKWTEPDKARYILNRVINEGETASYELLKILDFTWKRTLRPTLHKWIKRYSFRKDSEPIYSFGTKPCKDYQTQLKIKAKSILENQMEQRTKHLFHKQKENVNFIPLASNEGYVVENQRCKKQGDYIPNRKETVSPADLLRRTDKNILLVGKPGTGKTTIVQQMLRLWTEKNDTEPDYMFYFDESILSHSTKLMNLESLLFDVYVKVKEEDQREVLQDMKDNDENVVFIFDGVTGLQEDSVLKKIMNHDVLRKAKVIITCSTQFNDEPFLSQWPSQKVYVQGFNDESIRTYYQATLGHNPDLLNVVLNNQELFSLSYVPMYAFMITNMILLKEQTVFNSPHTVTNINIHFFFNTLMKHGDKNLLEIDEYLKEIKDQLHILTKNAFNATEQNSLNLPEISGDETDICSAFLKMITGRDSLTRCAFLHNTMQEFFSALWLVENPDEIEKVLKLCQTEENQHMRHVVPFLCGLLGEHNNKLLRCLFSEDQMKNTSEWFTEKLLDTFLKPQSDGGDIDLLYVCQCLYELQSSNFCLMFLEKMKHQLEIDVNLDPNQSCALSYVISQSTDKEVHLNLENCTVSDTGLIMILSCSPKIRLNLWKANFNQIIVLLHFTHKVSNYKRSMEDDDMIRSHSCCKDSYNSTTELADALLDLYSHVKDCETQTGRSLLPALQSVFQASPKVWSVDLSKTKTSILLEVLKLQTEKKPVELRGWTDDESQVMSFLQCLPYISQLRFRFSDLYGNYFKRSAIQFLQSLTVAAVNETVEEKRLSTLLSSVCSYEMFPFHYLKNLQREFVHNCQSDFLLDLCSHMKDCETQTGRSLLPALQSVYQTPDVWIIDLSKRKTSILLEVLKLQTEKKPVELRGWTDEESQVMSFLQCLPYISQLRFRFSDLYGNYFKRSAIQFLQSLTVAAVNETVEEKRLSTLLSSVCSYEMFPFHYLKNLQREFVHNCQSDFLLDLCSHMKDYETQTGRSLLPALQSVYQTPDVWIIDLSERKASILLEVLKLQTEKKPVELRGWTDEESQVMSFLQCLPYISQLRFKCFDYFKHDTKSRSAIKFLLSLIVAAENETTGEKTMSSVMSSVLSHKMFPFQYGHEHKGFAQIHCNFLLDLYSHVKDYETQTGRSLLPALQSVFQTPDVWIIDLSERKTSILLEVLKLQTEKKPVELRGWTDEESQVMSFLQCLPYISQLSFENTYICDQTTFLSKLFIKAAETMRLTGDEMLKLLTSVWTFSSLSYKENENIELCDFLLDLYMDAKNHETQTDKIILTALKPLYRLVPTVWSIDLSKKKTSILLEVLKLQTEKKPVKLRGWTDEESQVMSFLQCLPYISQLSIARFSDCETRFLLKLFIKAAETEKQKEHQMLHPLASACAHRSFPYEWISGDEHCDFLLDLYSQMKDCETQTGRSLLPALQSVYQTAADVWIIDLSERKTSILLEVLKLQTEKKPVELRGWTDDESQVMSFLQCLPYISQLRFVHTRFTTRFLLKLFIKAAESQTLKLLTSVCTYTSFPYEDIDTAEQSDFLLDLCSHVKDYETQTGRSLLPALQSVYQTAADVWIIDLSERKTSILLEVLKLQTEKKPVELRGWTDDESQVMSFLQCLPYISQLSGADRCVLSLFKPVEFRENPELVNSLFKALDFNLSLEGILPSSTCRFVGGVLHLSADRLTLTVKPQAISLRGTRLLFRHITNIQTLRLSGYMVVRIVRAVRSSRVPVTVDELSADLNDKRRSDSEMSRVLSSLASLLRLWTVQCLNLSDCRMKSLSLILLLSQQSPVTLRLSKETLQSLTECVYEAQEEELTSRFLQKVGRDLTPCALSWEKLHYFLQRDTSHVTVDLKETDSSFNIREILPFLNRIHFKAMSSTMMMSLMKEIYESRSLGFVSGLLSSVKNCINLQNRALDSVHCAFLRFILQNRTAVTLNMLWTSIPEEEIKSILPLLSRVSCLSVDRVLLLRMLHCCSSSDVQQASANLLSALQHKLDFSCGSALDLTEDTPTQTLQLTAEDCRVMSTVVQRVYRDTHTLTQLNLHDCQMNTAGIDQVFTILRSVKLQCGKSTLLQFLSHVDDGKAECLSRALGEEVDLSQTHLDLQVCRGLALVLEHSEGLTELDLSQCHLTDQSLNLLLPNLHKAQNIDFSGNCITDAGVLEIYSIVSHDSNIKTVRLFNNRIVSRSLFQTDPRFEIW